MARFGAPRALFWGRRTSGRGLAACANSHITNNAHCVRYYNTLLFTLRAIRLHVAECGKETARDGLWPQKTSKISCVVKALPQQLIDLPGLFNARSEPRTVPKNKVAEVCAVLFDRKMLGITP